VAAISTIDTIAHTNRWSHHHLGDKVVWAGGLVAAALLTPVWPGALAVTVCVLCSCVLAGIPLRVLFGILRVPLGFIVSGAVITAISLTPGRWPPIRLTELGAAAALAGRGIAGTAAAALLALTVPVPELLARARRVGVPAVVCEVAILMYRMIAVSLERLRWQRLAQENRLGYDGLRRSMRSVAALAAAAFVGSITHAQRLATGLGARGFDGTVWLLDDGAPHRPRFLAGAVSMLALVVVGSFLWGAS
jgi:cobalt/nickel transport system permease protein